MIFISLSLCFQNKKKNFQNESFSKERKNFQQQKTNVVVYFGLWTSEGISKVNSKNDKISKQRLNPCFTVSLQFIAGLNSITGHFDNLNLCIIKAFTCRKGHLPGVDSKIPQ